LAIAHLAQPFGNSLRPPIPDLFQGQ
jgi:hypothetical protein